MNSRVFRNKINLKRPRYEVSKLEIMDLLSKKGGKKGEFLKFGPYYQTYMYAFFIGYHRKERLPFVDSMKKEPFREIGQWHPTEMVDYILMLLFSDEKIIKYNWNELDNLDEKKLEDLISEIIRSIEEYANAGLAYLQEKIQTDRNEFADPFVFTNILHDIVDENKDKPIFLPIDAPIFQLDEELLRVKNLIEEGENTNIEFKSTLRYSIRDEKIDKTLILPCMKTIAAFLNSKGGSLFIGVDDEKNIIGLDCDFKSFGKKSDLKDEFQKYLVNQICNYLGDSVHSCLDIKFHVISNKMICEIQAIPDKTGPVFLKNILENNKEEFYIRCTSSSRSLSGSDLIKYKESHWG